MDKPYIIKGGVAIDKRGRVTFCNGFDMSEVKRFYMLENHEVGYIRAWHGHLVEAKYVVCVSGVAVVGVAEIEKVGASLPFSSLPPPSDVYYFATSKLRMLFAIKEPTAFTLHPNGDVLYIPPGYANGHKNLVANTRLLHFSTLTHEESLGDDYRFDAGVHGWVWE